MTSFLVAAAAVVGIAGTAFSVAGAMDSSDAAGISARAGTARSEAELKLKKIQQEEKNAGSELARQIQRINNNRAINAASRQDGVSKVNFERLRDDLMRGKVEDQIATAEGLGAYVAHTASKGVGGATSDILELTMRQRSARMQDIKDKRDGQLTYDAAQQVAGIMPDAWLGQDMTVINGGVENSVALPAFPTGNSPLSQVGSAMSMVGEMVGAFGGTSSRSSVLGSYGANIQPTSSWSGYVKPNPTTQTFSFSSPPALQSFSSK